MLNAGLGFSDEFELEVCNYSDKSGSKLQQYKEWVHTMRKEGTAFFKTVKNRVRAKICEYYIFVFIVIIFFFFDHNYFIYVLCKLVIKNFYTIRNIEIILKLILILK